MKYAIANPDLLIPEKKFLFQICGTVSMDSKAGQIYLLFFDQPQLVDYAILGHRFVSFYPRAPLLDKTVSAYISFFFIVRIPMRKRFQMKAIFVKGLPSDTLAVASEINVLANYKHALNTRRTLL